MSDYYSTTIQSKHIEFIHRCIISKALNDGDSKSLIAKELGLTEGSCKVEQIGGILEIEYTDSGELYMIGPSNFVFESEIDVSHIIGEK